MSARFDSRLVAGVLCKMEADFDGDSDIDEDDIHSDEDEDVEETSLGGPNFETVGYFDLLSLQEFTKAIAKRAAMISVGSVPCLSDAYVTHVLDTLKQKQNGEMLHWAEALALAEWIKKQLPVTVTSLGRTLDPNTAELAFRPLRDHVLSQKLAWLYGESPPHI